MLGDEAINLICGLLPPDGAKSGEQDIGVAWMEAKCRVPSGKEQERPGKGGGE